MTRQELCEELQAPADTPPGCLLAAWEQRRAELLACAAAEGNPKPVKLRLRRELNRLEEGAALAEELRVAADIARYFAELEAEWARPSPRRSIARLCLDKARPLVAAIADGELRFSWEKRVTEEEERLAAGPPDRPEASAPGAVLELIPLRPDATLRRPLPTVRLAARASFTLGRQAGADLCTRFGPESEENKLKTSTISRINTTLFIRGRQIHVQDGGTGSDGTPCPSRNGTLIDDRRVAGATPLDFSRERRLKLGQYFFEVGAVHLGGCVRFLPISVPAEPVVGVWMFSEASLGSSADAAVVLEGRLPPVAARIQYRDAGFWLAVPSEMKSFVKLDRRLRAAGDLIPLQASHELWVGEAGYTVRLRRAADDVFK